MRRGDEERRREAQAWVGCRRRAERTPRRWREAVVDDAIEARVRTGAYALLDEARAASWNDEARRLSTDVTDDLVDRAGESARPVVDEYVRLAVRDWFRLTSTSAGLAYLEATAGFCRDFGLRREPLPSPAVEVFLPAPGVRVRSRQKGAPRVEVHEYQDRVLVKLVDVRRDGGFTGRWGALGSAGEIVPLDADLLTDPEPPRGFPSALAVVLRAWHVREAEYNAAVYQAEMRHGHQGLEPFPSL